MAAPAVVAAIAAAIATAKAKAKKLKEARAEGAGGRPHAQDVLGIRLEKEKQIMRLRR